MSSRAVDPSPISPTLPTFALLLVHPCCAHAAQLTRQYWPLGASAPKAFDNKVIEQIYQSELVASDYHTKVDCVHV